MNRNSLLIVRRTILKKITIYRVPKLILGSSILENNADEETK